MLIPLSSGMFPSLPPEVSPPSPSASPSLSAVVSEIESFSITGTISNGWEGRTQQVNLSVPFIEVRSFIADELYNFVIGVWQWFINLDYWIPMIVISLAVIAIFTIQKREIRL